MTNGSPTAEQRIERELDNLAGISTNVRHLPAQRLAELADHHREAANGYLDAALTVDGAARLTFLRVSGQHATKAQIYGAAS